MKIFENYVAKFYTLKAQYSGIPVERKNDEENAKKELSEKLMQDFGIYVKWSDIPTDKNEAMRYVMKLILNSLWGELCQNPNKASVYFINDYEELMHHVENKQYKSVYFNILDSSAAHVVCNHKEEHNYKVNKVCVSIGSYITCYSRLKLLEYISTNYQKKACYIMTQIRYFIFRNIVNIFWTSVKILVVWIRN